MNLLTNAIKFSPNNNKINISAKIDGSDVIVSVVNYGTSTISKENQKTIFELFKQGEQRDSGGIKSTGLGLAFCKMAVEAHNGKIAVKSDEENGTEFWFSLPDSYISKNNNESTKLVENKSSSLSNEDKEYLKPFALMLEKIEIYEITSIDNVLSSIENNAENIQKWVFHIKEAAYQNNNTQFQELLKL